MPIGKFEHCRHTFDLSRATHDIPQSGSVKSLNRPSSASVPATPVESEAVILPLSQPPSVSAAPVIVSELAAHPSKSNGSSGFAGQFHAGVIALVAQRDSPITNPNMKLAASVPVLPVHRKMFLWTGFGAWLWKHGLLMPITVAELAVLLFLYAVPVGSQRIRIPQESDAEFLKLNDVVGIIQFFLSLSILVKYCHCLNSGILRLTVRTFDCNVLFLSYTFRQFMTFYSDVLLLSTVGEVTVVWLFLAICQHFILNVTLIYFLLCNLDAALISRRWKILGLCLYFAAQVYLYYKTRFGNRLMSSGEVCWWAYCAPPRRAILLTTVNLMVFICKQLVPLLMGNDFSSLKTSYNEYSSAEEARKYVKHACSDAGVRDTTTRSVSLRGNLNESSPLSRRVVQS
jgi:hypothetical protein